MAAGNRTIEANGTRITEGTGLFDTECGRVLWISEIDEISVIVKPVTDYEVDLPMGWLPGDQDKMSTEGTVFTILDLKSMIQTGRFDIGPPPLRATR